MDLYDTVNDMFAPVSDVKAAPVKAPKAAKVAPSPVSKPSVSAPVAPPVTVESARAFVAAMKAANVSDPELREKRERSAVEAFKGAIPVGSYFPKLLNEARTEASKVIARSERPMVAELSRAERSALMATVKGYTAGANDTEHAKHRQAEEARARYNQAWRLIKALANVATLADLRTIIMTEGTVQQLKDVVLWTNQDMQTGKRDGINRTDADAIVYAAALRCEIAAANKIQI